MELLDASWAQLGASWATLGPNLEPLGRFLDASWAKHARLEKLLSEHLASKMRPKRSWTYFGSNLGPLGANLSLNWSVLGASWAQLGVSWTHFLNASWVQLGASWAPRASLPGLLDAILLCTVGTGCSVQADLISKMIFGAPTCSFCALYTHLCSSPWPLERISVHCTPICAVRPALLFDV